MIFAYSKCLLNSLVSKTRQLFAAFSNPGIFCSKLLLQCSVWYYLTSSLTEKLALRSLVNHALKRKQLHIFLLAVYFGSPPG